VSGAAPTKPRVLVVRTDSDGDVLLAGPAVRAVARRATVTLLVSPAGEQAAQLLPGVHDVIVWPCPWSGYRPPPVDTPSTLAFVDLLREHRFSAAIVLTSFHQSALPVALLLRLAGVPWIGAVSEDYPGSLLDLRLAPPAGTRHEVERALDVVAACGYPADPAEGADGGRLAVRRPLPDVADLLPAGLGADGFVVLHPGASVPARAPEPARAGAIAAALAAAGTPVVVTGGPGERDLTATVTAAAGGPARGVHDLGGRTTLLELAAFLDAAQCVVVGNTGPAHLAAAVGTPVVSLFAPVVPATSWAPWGVPTAVLGDQDAPCRLTRARQCPVEGHPCLAVDPADVVAAVRRLTRRAPREEVPA
jgi:heptosyltransferase III